MEMDLWWLWNVSCVIFSRHRFNRRQERLPSRIGPNDLPTALILTDALEDHEGTVSIGGRTITNLCCADDIDGLAGEEEELANLAVS